MSEDLFGCHNGGKMGSTGIQWVAVRDAAKHPTKGILDSIAHPILQAFLVQNVVSTLLKIGGSKSHFVGIGFLSMKGLN